MSVELIKRLERWGEGASLSNHMLGVRSARQDCADAATALAEAQATIARQQAMLGRALDDNGGLMIENARLRSLIGRYGLQVGDAEGVDFTDGAHLTPQESAEVSALIDAAEAERAALSPVAPDQGEG